MLRKVALALVTLLVLTLVMLFATSPIEPASWDPPPGVPLEGVWANNDRLTPTEWWAKQLIGPEAITLNPDGTLLAGLKDGRVVKLKVGSDEPEVVVDTKGRPLAMEWHPDGRLIVCDAHAGLLAFSTDGKVEVLATGFGGIPFRFVDDLAITKAGLIYFSDASARFSIEGFTEDLLEHQTTGRVLSYDPATKQLALVADGLAFANGVALSGDESYLVVSETGAYRLWRVWLTGARAGQKELFANLPGFPDNVRWSPTRNGFWVALGSPRKPEVDMLAHWPAARRIIAALPKGVQPKPARISWVALIDAEGRAVESLMHEAPDSYSPIACATEANGWLYLGSFAREGVARFKLP